MRVLKFNYKDCEIKDCCQENFLLFRKLNGYEKLCPGGSQKMHWFSGKKPSVQIATQGIRGPIDLWIAYWSRREDECSDHDFQCGDRSGCYDRNDICENRYVCNDRSDQIGCRNCRKETSPCNAWSMLCFDPKEQRCDGVLDCPQGEDEMNCTSRCIGSIDCRTKEPSCIAPGDVCDFKPDCANSYDELTCSRQHCRHPRYFACANGRCVASATVADGRDDCGDLSDETNHQQTLRVALLSAATVALTLLFFKLTLRWFATRRDVERLARDPPEFAAPPFRGPGDSRSSARFSDTDFRVGGEIFEAFARTRRNIENAKPEIPEVVDEGCGDTKICGDEEDEEEIIKALVSLSLPYFMCYGLNARISETLKSFQESRKIGETKRASRGSSVIINMEKHC